MKIEDIQNEPLDSSAYVVGDRPQGGANTKWPFVKMQVDQSVRIQFQLDISNNGPTLASQKAQMMSVLRSLMKRYPARQYRVGLTENSEVYSNNKLTARGFTIWRTI